MEMMVDTPSFAHENLYWEQGLGLVAGVDEVGVGAWAGPVAAAAVVFDGKKILFLKRKLGMGGRPFIRDSKQLTAKQREEAEVWIKENAAAWAVGKASVEEITKTNILRASCLAGRRAVKALRIKPDLLLVDGRPAGLYEQIPAVGLAGGDKLSFSIAAASIVAKVYRDRLMVELDKKFPRYGLAAHKGYGSAAHKEALTKHGPSACHRPTYAPVAEALTAPG